MRRCGNKDEILAQLKDFMEGGKPFLNNLSDVDVCGSLSQSPCLTYEGRRLKRREALSYELTYNRAMRQHPLSKFKQYGRTLTDIVKPNCCTFVLVNKRSSKLTRKLGAIPRIMKERKMVLRQPKKQRRADVPSITKDRMVNSSTIVHNLGVNDTSNKNTTKTLKAETNLEDTPDETEIIDIIF